MVDVAQWDRASECESEGYGFDSRHSPLYHVSEFKGEL